MFTTEERAIILRALRYWETMQRSIGDDVDTSHIQAKLTEPDPSKSARILERYRDSLRGRSA